MTAKITTPILVIMLAFSTIAAFAKVPVSPAQASQLIIAQNSEQHDMDQKNKKEKQTVEITNSGSTNVAGYSITLHADGAASYHIAWKHRTGQKHDNGNQSGKVPEELAKRLFDDVNTAMPLSQYPPAHCMKSASFGTTLKLTYDGQHSPDLSCSSSEAKLEALKKDIQEVVDALNIKLAPGE